MSSYYEKFPDGKIVCIDEEIPFEIPEGWEWTRFGHITFNRDSERIPLSVSERNGLQKIYDYYGASGVIDKVDKYLFEGDLLLIGEDGANLINRSTPIAYIASGKYWVNNHAHVIDCRNLIEIKYLELFINAISLVPYVTGTAQPKMNQEKMNSILIAVAPLAEQLRIIEKVKSILPLIEKYHRANTKLDLLNHMVPELLRKSILNEAIQGRLVSQNPDEEPATKLLERINAEKLRLVKDGKLKAKDAVSSIIFKGDDNKYYEQIGDSIEPIDTELSFPESWVVCRLSTICQLTDGIKQAGPGVCLDAKYLRGKSTATILQNGKYVRTGDNIILVDGENSGEVFPVPENGYMGSTFKQLWISDTMCKAYVLHTIRFYKDALRNSKKGAAIPHLNKELFYNILIGIPPYEEQKRISERIEQLMSTL